MLIEIDMTKGCEKFIMFKSEGQVRFASLKYEQLQQFCNHCRVVSHFIETCWAVNGRKGGDERVAKVTIK